MNMLILIIWISGIMLFLCMILIIIFKYRIQIKSIIRDDNCLIYERTKDSKIPKAIQKNLHDSFLVRMHMENESILEFIVRLKVPTDTSWKWRNRRYCIDPRCGRNNASIGLLEYVYHERCSLPLKEDNILETIQMVDAVCPDIYKPKHDKETCLHCIDISMRQNMFKKVDRNFDPYVLSENVNGGIIRNCFRLTDELAKYVKVTVVISCIVAFLLLIQICVLIFKVSNIVPK